MKISFKNFKSYLRKSQLTLGRFNIVIGRNSSGKTALTDAIQIFSQLTSNNLMNADYNILDDLSKTKDSKKPRTYKAPGDSSVGEKKYTIFEKDAPLLVKYFNSISHHPFDTSENFSRDKIFMEYSIDYLKLTKKDSKSPFQNHYVKPIIFSENSNLNSSITNVIEEYSNKLFEYKNDIKPREDDKLLVKYGPNTTELRVDTKSELLNGLTFILDKKSNQRIMFHTDDSNISHLKFNAIDKICDEVFDSYIKFLGKKNKNNYKKQLFPPKSIRLSSSDFHTLLNDSSVSSSKVFTNMISYGVKKQAAFIESPLMHTSFLTRSHRSLVRSPKFYLQNKLFEATQYAIQHDDSENPFLSKFSEFFGTKTKENKIENLCDLEFTKEDDYKSHFTSSKYNYNDIFIVSSDSENNKNMTTHNKIRDSHYPWHYGFLFSVFHSTIINLDNGKQDKEEKENYDNMSIFLKGFGLFDLFNKYFNIEDAFDNNHLNSKLLVKIEEPLRYLSKSALYSSNFKLIIDEFLKELNSITNSEKFNIAVSTSSEMFGVPEKAIHHQLNVIFNYFYLNSLTQFKQNLFKYFNMEYKMILDEVIFETNIDDSNKGSDGYFSFHVIKPQIFDRNDKNKKIFTLEELDKVFNDGFSYLFKNDLNNPVLEENEENKLSDLELKLNSELKKMKFDFQVILKHQYYREPDNNKKLKTGNFLLLIKLSNGIILPINQCGMGHTVVLSIISSIHFAISMQKEKIDSPDKFNKNIKLSDSIITIREPETHLHPKLISEVLEYLFKITKKHKNIRLIIETHSEVVLRQTQVLTKNMKKTDKTTSDFVKVFYTSKVKNVKSSFTKITDLGIKNNGFLSEKIKTGFFDMNTNLIKNLWKRDKTSNKS